MTWSACQEAMKLEEDDGKHFHMHHPGELLVAAAARETHRTAATSGGRVASL